MKQVWQRMPHLAALPQAYQDRGCGLAHRLISEVTMFVHAQPPAGLGVVQNATNLVTIRILQLPVGEDRKLCMQLLVSNGAGRTPYAS